MFYHEERGIRTFVHGGGNVSPGRSGDLVWLRYKLDEKPAIKTGVLGDVKGETQELRFLNRMIRYEREGNSY